MSLVALIVIVILLTLKLNNLAIHLIYVPLQNPITKTRKQNVWDRGAKFKHSDIIKSVVEWKWSFKVPISQDSVL